jgi:hypothetical protein
MSIVVFVVQSKFLFPIFGLDSLGSSRIVDIDACKLMLAKATTIHCHTWQLELQHHHKPHKL